MLVLPRRIAPAPTSRAATSLSSFGMKLPRIFDPAVVRIPRVQKLSLSETGMPKRGLASFAALPRRVRTNSSSAARAFFRARSASTVKNALIDGFRCSMRASATFTSSSGEISLRLSKRAACWIERKASLDYGLEIITAPWKNLVRAPSRPGRANSSDAKYHKILILIANRTERKPAVFETESTTRAVITRFQNLVLKRLLREVVTQARRCIKPRPRQIAVPYKRAHLIRAGFEDEIRRILVSRRRKIRRRKMR